MKMVVPCALAALVLSLPAVSIGAQTPAGLSTIGKCDAQVSSYRKQLLDEKSLSRDTHMRHDMELAVLQGNSDQVSGLVGKWQGHESSLDIDDALQSGLSMAAWNGDAKMADLLIKSGAKPDEWTNHTLGNPAIVLASGCGHLDVMKVILQSGGQINTRSDVGVTAFEAALNGLHQDIALWVLSQGFDVCSQESPEKIGRMKSIVSKFHMSDTLAKSLQCPQKAQ